ncbi:pentatricopeptide repeat-containing protein [Pyrus ussuriensis x Pyrus communis]|uniref:Pentatricopeptide repeat-containing protein n=1 Tax=Pyrus ussuriensis x Pyrus communis TaxID=2448454 RepID=A0A5N5H8Q7_9ROSA|nr:pentatricopeptide repeat-containing protein [Pyrus ussuriensis x Pyrus communis]
MNPNGQNLRFLLDKSLTLKQLKQVHAPIISNGLHHLQTLLLRQVLHSDFTFSAAIARYVHLILHNLKNPDAFSWSCAIRYFSLHSQYETALSLYLKIKRLGLCPSSFAVSSALRACARILNELGGISIHAQVYKFGFCGCVYVQTALVDFYSKLGDMKTARKVFDGMPEKNVVSWNSVLSGYLKSGDMEEAQVVFDEIPNKDVVSWNSMVSGYARMGNMDKAYFLFQQIPQRSLASWNAMISGYVECERVESARGIFDAMPLRNNVSWITMISGYSKCGNVESARQLFDQMSERDVLLFNAMIACYAQNSQPKEAIELFNQMLKLEVNIQPNETTLASVISASSQLGDMKFGLWAEFYMSEHGIELDDHLATALVDLYTKCGDIDRAYKLFHGLKKRDVVAYSAMILGCGINGKAVEATKLFEDMVNADICPNVVTYTGLLTAYNHAGLVEEGYRCFNSMKEHGLEPSGDHYGIMVDLLGRAGQLDKAVELIRSMPMQPQAGVWGALLLACSLHNNVELGETAARNCFKLEPDKNGYYVLLANIYASAARWDDERRLRKVMEKKGFAKIPGCSWMDSM